MEAVDGHDSKLNKIIERPNREMHTKTRIDFGLRNIMDKMVWCFEREHAICEKRRDWHITINYTYY